MRFLNLYTLNKALIEAILKLTRHEAAFTLNHLNEAVPTPNKLTLMQLNLLLESGMLSREGDLFTVTPEQKIELAVQAVKQGASTEAICRFLSWQEFERIVQRALAQNEYETLRHFRIKLNDNRLSEIDLFAICGKIALAIDCKHWKYGWKRSTIQNAAKTQIERVKAIANKYNLVRIEKKFNRSLNGVQVIPVLVTLTETRYLVYLKVPVVPILKFAFFISELYGYIETFATITLVTPNLMS